MIKIPSGNQEFGKLRDALQSTVVVVDPRIDFLSLGSYLYPMVTQEFDPPKVQLKLFVRHKEPKEKKSRY